MNFGSFLLAKDPGKPSAAQSPLSAQAGPAWEHLELRPEVAVQSALPDGSPAMRSCSCRRVKVCSRGSCLTRAEGSKGKTGLL